MTIDQLEHIAAVAQTGSILRAAERLHMSQPALSRSIKRLEEELGCQLLHRTSNSSALTEAGRIAADYADDMLRTYRRMRDALASLETRRRTLRIGTCAPAPLWRVTQLVVETTPGTIVASESLDEQHLRNDFHQATRGESREPPFGRADSILVRWTVENNSIENYASHLSSSPTPQCHTTQPLVLCGAEV